MIFKKNVRRVGFCAEGNPWCGHGFHPGRGGPSGGFSPGSLLGTDGGTPNEGKYPPAAIPDPVLTAPENWTASCVITGQLFLALRGQTTFWTSNNTDFPRGGAASREAQGAATGGGGVDGGTGGCPGPAGTSHATGSKYQGMAHGAAVHSEWHGSGGPVVEGCPLLAVCAGDPGPPISL